MSAKTTLRIKQPRSVTERSSLPRRPVPRASSALPLVPAKRDRLSRLPGDMRSVASQSYAQAVTYAHALIDPGGVELSVSPSIVPRRGLPMRQVLERDISINQIPFQGTNQFYGEVQVDLNNTLLVTTSSSSWESANKGSLNFTGVVSASDKGSYISHGYAYSDNSSNILVAGGWLEAGTYADVMCFPIVYTAAATNTGTLTLGSTISEPIRCEVMTHAGGAWNSVANAVIADALTLDFAAVPIASGVDAISFKFTCIANGDAECFPFSFRLRDTSASNNHRFGHVPKNVTASELTNVSSISGLLNWRFVAQDVLGTCQASEFQNGGKVAAARVGSSWGGPASNAYSDLATIPYDRYDGPFKDGFHVNWLPSSVYDLDPSIGKNSFEDGGSTRMIFGGTCDTAQASMRIRVTSILEFYSLDPQYGYMPFSRPFGRASDVIYILATQVPAATSNKSHLLKKLGETVRAHLPSVLQWMLSNPDKVAAFGAAVAAL